LLDRVDVYFIFISKEFTNIVWEVIGMSPWHQSVGAVTPAQKSVSTMYVYDNNQRRCEVPGFWMNSRCVWCSQMKSDRELLSIARPLNCPLVSLLLKTIWDSGFTCIPCSPAHAAWVRSGCALVERRGIELVTSKATPYQLMIEMSVYLMILEQRRMQSANNTREYYRELMMWLIYCLILLFQVIVAPEHVFGCPWKVQSLRLYTIHSATTARSVIGRRPSFLALHLTLYGPRESSHSWPGDVITEYKIPR